MAYIEEWDTHQRIIKHLRENMEGDPHQTTEAPIGAFEGCEKGNPRGFPSQLQNLGQNDP